MYKNNKNIIKKIAIGDRLLLFGRNSGIHGLQHIFRENTFFLARIFWIVMVLVSSGVMYIIVVPVLERGDEVNFTPDTRYLTWTSTFPAVTVCEMYNSRVTQRKLAALYPDFIQPLDLDLRKYIAELMFGRGTCSKKVCVPCGQNVPCDLPWREMINSVHKKCPEILTECKFNGEEIPCCENFQPIESEYGVCYSFNTLQGMNSQYVPMFTVNRTTGPGLLTFRVITDVTVTVHSPEELPTDFIDPAFILDIRPVTEKRVDFLFSQVEMENDPALLTEDIEVRGCHYLEEVPPSYNYKVYSYGACRLHRVSEHKLEHCGCFHPIRQSKDESLYCNYTGLNCIVATKDEKHLGIEHKEEHDDCLPSCVESELSVIHSSSGWVYNDTAPGTSVRIRMLSLPTLRYRRSLVRTDLDFVVSVGGIAGLFFGASLLSLVEVIYLVCRPHIKNKK